MINITLKTNKECQISVPEDMRTAQSDVLVISGEADVTEIVVTYPPDKASWNKRVDITNARKETIMVELEGFDIPNENKTTFTFSLPSGAVRYKGYTTVTFKAFEGGKTFIWKPIELPVLDGGMIGCLALDSPDLIEQAYDKSNTALNKAAAAEANSTKAKQDAGTALNKMNALVQPPDVSAANFEGTVRVEFTEDGRLKFANLKGGTPQIKLGNVTTLPPGSSTIIELDNSDPLSPTFHFAIASGKDGPPGDGVATGMSTVQVYKKDWQLDEAHGYKLVIPPERHNLGATNKILVEADPYLDSAGAILRTSFDSAEKARDGTVTLYSRVRWEGTVLLAAGVATAIDAEARGQIGEHKSDTAAHITTAERESWNAKETPPEAQSKADQALQSAKSYTDNKIAEIVGAAPELLDTLQELSTAVGDNPNHTTEMLEMVGKKADKVSFDTHAGDSIIHIAQTERTAWNGKETPEGAQLKADAALSSANSHTDAVTASKADKTAFDTHTADKSNPHGVTAEQVGALPVAGGSLTGALQVADVSEITDPTLITQLIRPIDGGTHVFDLPETGQKKYMPLLYFHTVARAVGYGLTNTIGHMRGHEPQEAAMYIGAGWDNKQEKFFLFYQDGRFEAPIISEAGGRVYSPNNPPAAEDIQRGIFNALRIPADYLQAGNNISLSRDAQTGRVTITASFGTVAPYTRTVQTSEWTSNPNGGYQFTINASTHSKGTDPQVETYNADRRQTYDSPAVDAAGNVTLYSRVQTTLHVKI